MGIEEYIKNLAPKRKKLYETFIAMSAVIVLLYAALSFLFTCSSNIYCFFTNPAFMISVVGMVILALLWKILHGGSIKPPEPTKQKEYNIPNPFGVESLRKDK